MLSVGVGQAVCSLLRAGRAEEPGGGDKPAPGGDPGGGHPPREPAGCGRSAAQPCLPRDSHRVHQQAPQAGQEGRSAQPELVYITLLNIIFAKLFSL